MTRQARDLIDTLNGQADLFDIATDQGSEEMSFAFRDRPFVDQLVSEPQLYGEDLFGDLYRVQTQHEDSVTSAFGQRHSTLPRPVQQADHAIGSGVELPIRLVKPPVEFLLDPFLDVRHEHLIRVQGYRSAVQGVMKDAIFLDQ